MSKIENIVQTIEEKIDKIINNETHILVGTQLISKGFHFPSLNCIVVVDIDLSSQGHDLRSAEKNLQLYHQLSGRAGRTGKPATVFPKTAYPSLPGPSRLSKLGLSTKLIKN